MQQVHPNSGFNRRHFIGGSDARIIMGQDEKALIRLWQEKRGEVGPEDLSGNLVVQLGLATEDLNRVWYEHNTGQAITAVQTWVKHPVIPWMAPHLARSALYSKVAKSVARLLLHLPGFRRGTADFDGVATRRSRTPGALPLENSIPKRSSPSRTFSRVEANPPTGSGPQASIFLIVLSLTPTFSAKAS
jgi:hypothetical protein